MKNPSSLEARPTASRRTAKRTAFNGIVAKRVFIQAALGIGTYVALSALRINLLWVIGAGALIGVVAGKVFCRWVCPIGFFMELMMGMSSDTKFKQMYQYHKMGCPIAWISGFLNKFSLFGVRREESSCTSCGACDRACYISSLESGTFSLFKKDMRRPGESFSCSRCLQCVSSCPTGSLSFSLIRTGSKPKR